MGGCRCTYRNCTVKSDGKVHMFHYPVFERVRCHQWLLNANRLDFLNLRVSQLKNRVVCQHHFKEDNFMNYKKDKLTFDAIPTLDGPYCDSREWITQSEDSSKVCPIVLEDIENDDCAVYDKKANFSVRYGDFLTNSELMDFDTTDVCNKISLSDYLKTNNLVNEMDDNIMYKNEPIYTENFNLSYKPLQETNKTSTQPTLKVVPYIINSEMNSGIQKTDKVKKETPKIKILSEKKIKEPISITGTFKKVSPTIILPPPNKNNAFIDIKPIKEEEIKSDCPDALNNISFDKTYVVQVEYDPAQVHSNDNDNKITNTTETSSPHEKLKQISSASPELKISQLKNKLTPERMAAINSKRAFNKKMRNIIEACLDKKECAEISKTEEDIKNEEKKPVRLKSKDQTQVPFKQLPHKEPILSNVQESTIAYLEARMQKLENNLVSRIDQNTKQISELKNSFAKGSLKKDSYAQTNEHEESYKKFLYQEISRFLSPSSNSTIYEELFINKYAIGEQNCKEISKRRRRR